MVAKSTSVPQTRSLDKIRAVIQAIQSGRRNAAELSAAVGLSGRHVGYHLSAAHTLGWIDEAADNALAVSERGMRLLRTRPHSSEETREFETSILQSAVLRDVAPDLLDPTRSPSLHSLAESISRTARLSASTARSRAQALLTWRERIIGTQPMLFEPHSPEERGREAKVLRPTESRFPVVKEVSFNDWKSFRSSKLLIEVLTILIGTNGGGKSNALDGLELLKRLALGDDLHTALAGGQQTPGLRGGIDWAARYPNKSFTLGVVIEGPDPRNEYEYHVTVETHPRLQIQGERLERIRYREKTRANPGRISIFRTDPASQDAASVTIRLYNEKAGTKREMRRSSSILSQLSGTDQRREIGEAVDAVIRALRAIFILDPIPSRMRDYTPLSDSLSADASNVAGVLAALDGDRRREVEKLMTRYLTKLPERDIERVWAEVVGKFASDAMLYCRERWTKKGTSTEIDARGMSDGTLRFISILAALLTRPSGSLLVVEEVDNGLHPSRAGLLIDILKSIGGSRRVDVLVTTHNKALLDQLEPELLPSVVVAHRNTEDGTSELTSVEDIKSLPKLLASGSFGNAVASGALDRTLSQQ